MPNRLARWWYSASTSLRKLAVAAGKEIGPKEVAIIVLALGVYLALAPYPFAAGVSLIVAGGLTLLMVWPRRTPPTPPEGSRPR